MLGGLMSGKLEVPLAPGWSWELDLRPGGYISCPECQLNRPPGKPMGRGANQGQRNKGFDETGGPMGAQANQGQRSMVFDEPGSSIGRGEDSKFLYMDFRFIALTNRVGPLMGFRGFRDTRQTPPETCPPCPCDRDFQYGPKWQDNLILY